MTVNEEGTSLKAALEMSALRTCLLGSIEEDWYWVEKSSRGSFVV
jgi:hypothetical protein